MTRRPLARLLVLLGSALIAGALLLGGMSPARAASLGEVALSQENGNVNDTPMFATAKTAACPAGYGENAGLRVGPADQGPYSNLGRPLGGGGFDQAPITIEANRSFTTALGRPPANGAWWVIIECFSLTEGRHPDEFRTPIMVCGELWQVGTSCGSVVPTETALTIAPGDLVLEGTEVTLTATVTPAAAGSVEFSRITQTIDGPVTEVIGTATVTGGTATLTLATLPEGKHTLTADFTPADANAHAPSRGTAPFEVYTGAKPTETTLTAAPAGPVAPGASVTFTATVKPADAAGSVRFERRSGTAGADFQELGTANPAGGVATFATTTLPAGSNNIRAVFVPTDAEAHRSSTSVNVDITVTGPGGNATVTTSTLQVAPVAPVAEGTEVTMTATVSPAAAGSFAFLDGTTSLGTAVVSGSTAEFKTSALAAGTHQLTARFTPTDTAAFAPSTSAAVSFEVTAAGEDPPPDDDNPGDEDPINDDDNGGSGGGALAKTGAPIAFIAGGGVLLLGGGVTALLLGRKPRRRPEVGWADRTTTAPPQ